MTTAGVGPARVGTIEAHLSSLLERLPVRPSEDVLAGLPWSDCVLALALHGVCSDGAPQDPGARLALLATHAGLLEAAVHADAAWPLDRLETLWRTFVRSEQRLRLPLAVHLALAPRLPLGLEGPDALLGVAAEAAQAEEAPDDVRARAATAGVVGLAIGRAAGACDWHAVGLVRLALEEPHLQTRAGRALQLGLLRGLGGGPIVAGLEALIRLAEGALSQSDQWWRGVVRLWSHLAGEAAVPPASVWPLATRILSGLSDARGLASEFLAVLWPGLDPASEPPHPTGGLAAFRWFDLAAPKRALLLRHLERFPRLAASPSSALTALLGGGEALLGERHPEVVTALCDLSEVPAPWPLARLLRACSDLPGAELQGRIASRLAALSRTELRSGSGEGRHAPRDARSADIIALPPAALARDELDLLRAAIHARDGDRLTELASRVPLDRRSECREALLGCLDVPDAPLRRGAISALGRVGSVADAPALIDVARRCRALEGVVASALRSLQARAVIPDLIEVFVRRLKWADDEALDDLWQLAGAACVPFLLRGLTVRYYPLARAGAARALGRHRVQEAVFALRTLALADAHGGTRQVAGQALADLHGAPVGADEVSGYGLLYRSAEALPEVAARAREAGAEALPGLRRVLAKGSWRRREAACEVLATLPGDAARDLLVEALSDPDDDVRFAACEALTQRGWQPATPHEATLAALAARRPSQLERAPGRVDPETLLASLRLGGHAFRTDVVGLLDRLGLMPLSGPEHALVLASSFDLEAALRRDSGLPAVLQVADQTWQTEPHRARIASALRGVAPDRLAEALHGGGFGWRARQTVAEALSGSLAEGASTVLAELVADDEDDVRRATLQALAWCGLARRDAGLDAAVVGEGFLRAFLSPFPDDRDQAAHAAATLGPALLPTLTAWVADPWWEIRQAAARTLAGWTRALDVAASHLVRLAVDPEYKVAEVAREALATFGVMPDIPGRVLALAHATAASLDGAAQWFVSRGEDSAHPELAAALDHLIDVTPPDRLAQRVGLIPLLGVSHLASWLEEAALGRAGGHIGLRLAASEALRSLVRPTCVVCSGATRLPCPVCDRAGVVTCQACAGSGRGWVPCPADGCSAQQVTRRIDAPRCTVCQGRGQVREPCACQASATPGRVPCVLCGGIGTLACAACADAPRA